VNKKIVETAVTHPRAVAIMQELEGRGVGRNFSHHGSNAPSNEVYSVIFTNLEDGEER